MSKQLKSVLFGGVALALFSAAAQAAGNAFVEVRLGGAATSDSGTETIGAALGYDAKIGGQTWFGAEFVVDTDSSFEGSVAGINLRLGLAVDEQSRVFLTLGRVWQEYSTTSVALFPVTYVVTTNGYVYDTVAGIGYQSQLSQSSHVSVQYQHGFEFDFDRVMVGVGLEF